MSAGGTEGATSTGTGDTNPTATGMMTTVGLDSSGGGMTATGGTTMAVDSTADDDTSNDSTASTTDMTGDDSGDTGTLPPFDPMCDEGGSGSGSGSGTDSGGSDSGGTSGTGGGAPNGSGCSADDDCASGECFVVPILGGICGECNEDADCPDGGCSVPNPLAGTPSACNSGEQGGGCESDDACCGIGICGVVLDASPIIEVSTCGQCAADSDCPSNALCQPDLDVVTLSGVDECVLPGSLPNGHSCTVDSSGDSACDSGICGSAQIMGIVTVGICSECQTDGDCAAGETCTPPEVDLSSGLNPGTCA